MREAERRSINRQMMTTQSMIAIIQTPRAAAFVGWPVDQ